MFCIMQVSIKEARGLPPALAHFVFCQYVFWGHGAEPSVVPPVVNSDVLPLQKRSDGVSVTFDHHKV
jgi:kinesin family protein 13